MTKMIKEFRDFILKGNMLDMAIGIIIGAAFGTVIKSLVNNVLMPPIGVMMGGVDFSSKKIPLPSKEVDGEIQESAILYGQFINDVIALIIVGLCIFMVVKVYNKAKDKFEKKEEEAPKEPKPSNEEKLLTEIRDLLAKQS